MNTCVGPHLGPRFLVRRHTRKVLQHHLPSEHAHTHMHSPAGTSRVRERLFHMHVAVLASFPGAGPPGCAGKQGNGGESPLQAECVFMYVSPRVRGGEGGRH